MRFRRRYRLYVWDHYDPLDSIDRIDSKHYTVGDAVAAAKPPRGCPPCGWSFRVVDRRSDEVVREWSSAIAEKREQSADPLSAPRGEPRAA